MAEGGAEVTRVPPPATAFVGDEPRVVAAVSVDALSVEPLSLISILCSRTYYRGRFVRVVGAGLIGTIQACADRRHR